MMINSRTLQLNWSEEDGHYIVGQATTGEVDTAGLDKGNGENPVGRA